jgi:hypothetical protein
MEESTPIIPDSIDIEGHLKRVAAQLIAAYQHEDMRVLVNYAQFAWLTQEEQALPCRRLFMRLIQVYHPDKIAAFTGLLERCRQEGAFDKHASLLKEVEERKKAHFAEYSAQEEYGFADGDPGYGLDEGGWDDGESEEWREEEDEGERSRDLIDAIADAFVGNNESRVTVEELELLAGDLDLSDRDIADLHGAEYLVGITSLNLAKNRIDNVFELASMSALESLDLSDNLIENADALASLEYLEELDLSRNDIEDWRFLTRLGALKCILISGNPSPDRETLRILRERSVLVIS